MRYPCREEQGLGCCFGSTGCKFRLLEGVELEGQKMSPHAVWEIYSSCNPPARPESEDWEYLEGELMTAPDRFIQGFMVGILSMLVTGTVVFWYLSGGIG